MATPLILTYVITPAPKVRGLRPACLHNYIQGAPGTMAHGIRGFSKLRIGKIDAMLPDPELVVDDNYQG